MRALRWRGFWLLVLCLCCGLAMAQTTEAWLLWPAGAPDSHDPGRAETVRVTPQGEHVLTHVSQPSITPFLPAPGSASGIAVVIVPGGGHSEIWIDHEGYNVARWLQQHGVAAFVLKYRLARERSSTYTVEGTELADTQRAIRLVRSRTVEEHIDVHRTGVMGFSAGGELAALASTRFDQGDPTAVDPIDRQSSRPPFRRCCIRRYRKICSSLRRRRRRFWPAAKRTGPIFQRACRCSTWRSNKPMFPPSSTSMPVLAMALVCEPAIRRRFRVGLRCFSTGSESCSRTAGLPECPAPFCVSTAMRLI